MALITRPNTYVAGATILASEVNSNETTIYDEFNGNINDANVKAAAAIAQSKLLFAGGANGKGLIWDSTAASKASFLDLPVYLTAAGTDTYTAAQTPALAAYRTGQTFVFNFTLANTAAATINVDALGAKAIKKYGTTALAAGDIIAAGVYLLIYDGTNFQLVSPLRPQITSSTADVATSETTTSTTYTDLATVGPAVTITPGRAADQIIHIMAAQFIASGIGLPLTSVAIAGAAAADADATMGPSNEVGSRSRFGVTILAAAVANGSTHTAKYRVTGGTGTFLNRRIIAYTIS